MRSWSHWTMLLHCAESKGASRTIAVDQVPERLERAKEQGCEVNNFSIIKDVSQKVYEMVHGGLDVALDCGECAAKHIQLCLWRQFSGTFHEPKISLHKGMKMLMVETDVPETANEIIVSVRKMGRCCPFATYAGFTNGFNIGAFMEKGVRFIGNGQAPVHKSWREILRDYTSCG